MRARRGKGNEESSQWDATDVLASTTFPRFIVSESVPVRPLFPSLFARRIPIALLFFISLYGLIPSFPHRARYIYRLVSPSGSCLYHTATSPGPLAVRPPKLSRRHDLCFLRPSGGLIPFCCWMCTCAAAPPSLSHPTLSLSSFLLPARSRASTDLPHTTDYPRSSCSRRPLRPGVPLLHLLPRLLFSGSVTLSVRSFLPLTALYRLVTSVSRARDLRASAPGWTIEHYDFSVSGSFYLDRDGQIIYKSIFTRGIFFFAFS